jgi:hypothetical protein
MRPPLVPLFATLAFIAAFQFATRHFPADGPGIVDLQLSISPGVFRQIVALWGPDHAATAWWAGIGLGFAFPLAYAALLSRAYLWLCETELLMPRPGVAAAPWVAAAFDWIANAVMLWLLAYGDHAVTVTVRAMSAAAAGKLTVLTVTAGFIIAALVAGERGRVLGAARYAVISLLVGTLPILALEQGRDLLVAMSSPEAGWHPFWFLAWLVVWAFSVWYWSRVLLDAGAGSGASARYWAWAVWLPRTAGALTLAVPGVVFAIDAGRALTPARMYWLALACGLLTAAFLWFVIRRDPAGGIPRGKSAEGYAPRLVSWQTAAVFAVSLATSAAMFVWLTFAPLSAGRVFGAAPILIIAAANTVFFGSLAVFATRSRRIPIEMAAFACAAVFSLWNDNHDVRLVAARPPIRQTLDDAFLGWRAAGPSAGTNPLTVVVAAAEGGGIRAAYWTSLVLHTLDREVPEFSRRLLAISSVSGSSIGAAVYAALQRDRADDAQRLELASAILREKFLAPMIAKLVAGDFLQWFLPWPVARFDRARAMEDALALAYRTHTGQPTFDAPFLDLRRGAGGRAPLLLLNGTSVQLGQRLVTSPVVWGASANTVGGGRIDLHDLLGADLRVATAVHNTARFPYISPAGRLRTPAGEDVGHIVDGGYFENSGADTLLDLITALRVAGGPPIRFVVLAIRNSRAAGRPIDDKTVAWRSLAHLGEWFAPVRALLQAREARGEAALSRLRETVGEGDFIELRLCQDPQAPGGRSVPDPPLAWQLSEEMAAALDAQRGRRCFAEALGRVSQALQR